MQSLHWWKKILKKKKELFCFFGVIFVIGKILHNILYFNLNYIHEHK